MKCTYCKQEIKKEWNFCPVCGNEVKRGSNITDIVNKQLEQLRGMFTPREYERRIEQPRSGVMISITHGFRQPHISVAQERPHTSSYNPKRKLPETVIEPKMDIKRLSDAIVVNVELPGVKSEQDVGLSRLADSIELRAHAGDKGYFKILKIPYRNRLVERSLDNGKLNLKFSI